MGMTSTLSQQAQRRSGLPFPHRCPLGLRAGLEPARPFGQSLQRSNPPLRFVISSCARARSSRLRQRWSAAVTPSRHGAGTRTRTWTTLLTGGSSPMPALRTCEVVWMVEYRLTQGGCHTPGVGLPRIELGSIPRRTLRPSEVVSPSEYQIAQVQAALPIELRRRTTGGT